MIKNNKGFISISIVYSFFLVFMLLLVLIMSTYVNNRTQSTIYKNDIKQNKSLINGNKFSNYLINSADKDDINLFTDGNDYRFKGLVNNNYVTFNDELWRIIGIFDIDGKWYVKLIRNDHIGEMMYDAKEEGVASSLSNNGSNNWASSQLMMFLNNDACLNECYFADEKCHEYTINDEGYVIADGISIYRNMGSYQNGSMPMYFPDTVSVLTGYDSIMGESSIKTLDESAISMIYKNTWYLGGIKSINNEEQFYSDERSDDAILWKGEVGLLYPSDYYLAKDGNDNWLSYLNDAWFISSDASSYSNVITIASDSFLSTKANTSQKVYPAIYLNNDILYKSGDGSYGDPYEIE